MKAFTPSWIELGQLGVALLTALGGFLLPPPSVLAASAKAWPIQFVVAVLCGLFVVAGRRWQRRRDARRWVGVALTSLGLALILLLLHRVLLESWTCAYYGTQLITGSEPTAYARVYLNDHPSLSCEELLKVFTGRREEIWTRASLLRNELLLTLSYLSVIPLMAASAIATLQAVGCCREPERRADHLDAGARAQADRASS